MGLQRGYIGILEKKMETTIEGLGFRVYLIDKPRPSEGLNTRIPSIIPIRGGGFLIKGLDDLGGVGVWQ